MSGNRPDKVWENISVGEMKGYSPLAEFVSCPCVYRHSSESGAPRAWSYLAVWLEGEILREGDQVGCSMELSSWLRWHPALVYSLISENLLYSSPECWASPNSFRLLFWPNFWCSSPGWKWRVLNYPLLWFKTSTQVLGEEIDSGARAGMVQAESGESRSYQSVREH